MNLIPHRLFQNPQVRLLLSDGAHHVLHKSLSTPTIEQESYVSQHVLSIVLNGTQHLTSYDDEIIRLDKGDALIAAQGMYTVTDLLPQSGEFESLLFFFSDELAQQFLRHLDYMPNQKQKQETAPFLKMKTSAMEMDFAQQLIRLYSQQSFTNAPLAELKTLEFLHLLANQFTDLIPFLFQLSIPRKRNLRSFMEANFAKPLKVEDYAKLTGRSLSSFRRDFLQQFDMTPQQWLRDQRMQLATQLLSETNQSVQAIAEKIGYENSSSFIQRFRQHAGLSPKQFALQRRKE